MTKESLPVGLVGDQIVCAVGWLIEEARSSAQLYDENPFRTLWQPDQSGLQARFMREHPSTQIAIVEKVLDKLVDYQNRLGEEEKIGGGMGWLSPKITKVILTLMQWLTFIPDEVKSAVLPRSEDCVIILTTRHSDGDDPQKIEWNNRPFSASVLKQWLVVCRCFYQTAC